MKKRIVVLGAGLAGTLLANRLSESFDVTCLEIGPARGTRYPDVVFAKQPLAHVKTFCHGAGGGTNLWHNGLLPLRTEDIVDPLFRSVVEESMPFMDEAASQLHFPLASYSDEFEKLSEDVAPLAASIADFPDGVDSLVYPRKYSPLQLSPAVSAYYDVNAVRFEAAGGRITQVRFVTGDAETALPVDELLVAAGGLGTPKLLDGIVAGVGRPDLKPGRGFIDHPMGFVGKFRFPRKLARRVAQFSLLNRSGYQSRNIIRLKSECGQYTGGAFFRPAVTMSNELALYKYKSLLGISRGFERIRTALSPKILHPDILAEIISHVFDVQLPTRTFAVLFIGEQRRNEHRVHYEGDRLHVDWTINSTELQKYQEMISRLGGMLADVAEEHVLEPALTASWFWSAAHHSGTTSMGNSDADLIDKELQLRCTENVHVCDASVIQEHSYANTGLTIGQLAMRLARKLEDAV